MTPALGDLARAAALWSYAGLAARLTAQFAGGIVLARLLGPEPFGTVAAAWVVLGAASQLAEGGFGAALIQREEIGPRQIRYAFTLQALTGLLLTALLLLAAAPAARLTGHAQLAPVLTHLAPVLLLQSLGQTAASLLRRRLDLRALQLTQLAATLAGTFGAAIPLAARGWGAESLVAGQLVQSGLTAVVLYALVRHPVRPCLSAGPDGFARFGAAALATNLANWALAGFDNLAATRAFGAPAAGLLHRAQLLTTAPGGQLIYGLQSVLFPAYARHRGEAAAVRRVYLGSLGAAALVLAPLAAALAAAAPTAIIGLYGARWRDAAPLLPPLAFAMPLQGLMALSGPLLWARARVTEELAIQSLALLLFLVALTLASRYSPTAIAWAVAAVSAFRAAAMVHRALAACDAAWRDLFRVTAPAAALAALAGLAALTADQSLSHLSGLARLAAVTALTSAALLPAAALLAGGRAPGEVRHLADHALGRLRPAIEEVSR